MLIYLQLKMVNPDQKKKIFKTLVKDQKFSEMELMEMMVKRRKLMREEH